MNNIRRFQDKQIEIIIINNVLRKLGIPEHLSGYAYIRFAIYYILEAGEVSLTKEIYPACAKYYNCGISSIDRSIRFCIEKSWIYGNSILQGEIFNGYIDYNTARPSSNTFICRIAEYINNYQENNLCDNVDVVMLQPIV